MEYVQVSSSQMEKRWWSRLMPGACSLLFFIAGKSNRHTTFPFFTFNDFLIRIVQINFFDQVMKLSQFDKVALGDEKWKYMSLMDKGRHWNWNSWGDDWCLIGESRMKLMSSLRKLSNILDNYSWQSEPKLSNYVENE